jgi:hypothetical protein
MSEKPFLGVLGVLAVQKGASEFRGARLGCIPESIEKVTEDSRA